MAIKYFCDGCDKDIPTASVLRVDVGIKTHGETGVTSGEYDLCKSCRDHLLRDSNPKNWTRCAPARKSA